MGDRRVAVIGGGRMGTVHLRALAAERITAMVVDGDPRARARGEEAGLKAFASVDDLLESAAADAAIVATPTPTHEAVVGRLLRAGLPTLCEKPAGLDVATTRRLAAESDRTGTPLQVAYWRRFVPVLVRLRQSVTAGRFGPISLVTCWQWDHVPPPASFRAASGGLAVDMGVHEFDQVRWLTGQEFTSMAWTPSGVRLASTATEDPESGIVVAALSAGTVAVVTLGRSYPAGDMCRVELIGPRAAEVEEFIRPADGDEVFIDAVARQARAFVDHVTTGATWTGASIAEAVAALDVAERVTALMR